MSRAAAYTRTDHAYAVTARSRTHVEGWLSAGERWIGFSDIDGVAVGWCWMLSGWCRVVSGLEVSGVSVRGCRGCQSVRMCARALSGAVGVVGLSGEFGCCQVVSDCRGFGKSSLTLWCQACIKVRPRQQQTRSLGIEPKHAYLEIYAPQNFFKPKIFISTSGLLRL